MILRIGRLENRRVSSSLTVRTKP